MLASCLALMMTAGGIAAAAQGNDSEVAPGALTGTMQIDGQTYVYANDAWSTEQEYLNAHPDANKDIEFWGVDEFATWLEQQKGENQKLADNSDPSFYYKDKNGDGAFREWTQEDVDALYKQGQEQLARMKEGYQYTKTITLQDGAYLSGVFDPGVLGLSTAPSSTVISLPDGSEVDLGHFDTASEATDAVKAYIEQQVKAGKLTQLEGDTILSHGTLEE